MRPGEFFTWNRVLNIAVLDGRLPSDELRDRTLSFTFTDECKEFDHIEWQLDNTDGLLTRPEYTGVGLFVAMQLGYPDGPTASRVFVINRMTGGVGVWGRERPAVGQSESQITFYGRNRNAPGGKTGHRTLPKTARPPSTSRGGSGSGVQRYTAQGKSVGGKKGRGGGRKTYGPTLANGTVREMLLDQKQPERWIPANSTSDAVRAILTRHGFTGDYAQVEDTPDEVPGVQILQGESDGEFLQRAAAQWGYICKLDGDTYHFHRLHWKGARSVLADVLEYGSSPDILSITIDCDFQLPVPSSVKAKSYNPRTRLVAVGDASYDASQNKSNMGIVAISQLRLDAGRDDAMTREDVIPVRASSQAAADAKAQQWFTQRHMRAFQLSVETVGNPKLLATRAVQIKGTGSPFVDGAWIIGVARHTIGGSDYKTSLRLTHPKKNEAVGTEFWGSAGDVPYDRRSQKSAQGIYRVGGYKPTPVQKAVREQWGTKGVEIRSNK